MKLLNKIITYIKNEPFKLDPKLSLGYFLSFILTKGMCFFYGKFLFLFRKRCFVHPSSVIKHKKKIFFGYNFNIDRWCYIDACSIEGMTFGNNVSIGKYTMIECTGSFKQIGKGLIVGDNVGLGTRGNFGCAGGVVIGSNTIIGSYVSFHSENHNYVDKNELIRHQGVSHKGIKIGENCWIGAKATILDGAQVGDGSIIAAGAVVRGIFEKNSVIGGVPAKLLKKRF